MIDVRTELWFCEKYPTQLFVYLMHNLQLEGG